MGATIVFGRWACAEPLEKITTGVFGPPSLSSFLPPIIKKLRIDEGYGFDLTFVERTPDAYNAAFNAGEWEFGAGASVITLALREARGVKAAYLFNLFDYYGAVITSRPEIRTLKDLEGREIAAARATTNYVMFDWFAHKLNVETKTMSVINTATPGLVGYALADRAAAVHLWEPAYTVAMAMKPDLRTLDLQLDATWKDYAGSLAQPYVGVEAQQSWIDKHRKSIPRLYAVYRDAARWVTDHPEEAAKIIGAKFSTTEQFALVYLIRSNERLRMHVAPASALRREIEAVYRAGMQTGTLSRMPSAATIYADPLE
jgi:ABC-type nitrate/sulfonate/bicarbonate transport system substrate-binding protein